jgi:hypothetical protein
MNRLHKFGHEADLSAAFEHRIPSRRALSQQEDDIARATATRTIAEAVLISVRQHRTDMSLWGFLDAEPMKSPAPGVEVIRLSFTKPDTLRRIVDSVRRAAPHLTPMPVDLRSIVWEAAYPRIPACMTDLLYIVAGRNETEREALFQQGQFNLVL